MKNYTITVNGNVYEVTVEEGFTGKAAAPKAAAPVQAPKARSGSGSSSGPGSSPGSCGSTRWCSRQRCSDSSHARQDPWREGIRRPGCENEAR